ncbi:DoxX family membrane protein [Rubrobacter tropicus]|uniref:DoxX family membrane protein n=1 Tax=Rubrobacter tropicus TaxID=2653851 RepID=A0A6G8QBP7_9ACTN|nr:DoxX family protein [Rubrobacter tropicus]QIN83851.1 DoxX family membrane protein [Rubrobacter tropicus]
MRTLALSPFAGLAGLAPLVVRIIVGTIMAVHGFQKLVGGPANFGAFLQQLGVPAPTLMAYVVTFVELVGGILLILGLFSRLAALLLTINLTVAILLVKLDVGLIAPADQPGVGYELDLALIAGFLVILFAGPGPISIDRILGLDGPASDRA